MSGCNLRIGQGYDVHRLVEGRPLILGGVEIPWEKGLLGHSDADVIVHALMDALLAVSLPVIEVHLTDPSRREEFRHRSYVAMAAMGSVVGLGFTGYRRAMELLLAMKKQPTAEP